MLFSVEELVTLLSDSAAPAAARCGGCAPKLRAAWSVACASSRKRRKSSLSSVLVSAAEEADLGTEREWGAARAAAVRASVLTMLWRDEMDDECGRPLRCPDGRVCGDDEMRPDGAADAFGGAAARSVVQGKGMAATCASPLRVRW